MSKKMMLLSGRTNEPLAKKIATELSISLVKRMIETFKNGEINVEIEETVAGAEVFILQSSITGKVNDNFVESLVLIDAAKRARASKVYLVIPLYPYSRKDRREANKKGRPKRTSIAAKIVANCYTQAVGVHGIITVKIHAEQIEGYFDNDYVFENIDPAKLFINYLKEIGVIKEEYPEKSPTIVAPDVGAAKSADDFSKALHLETYVIADKRRAKPGEAELVHIIGDYSGRDCIIYDDMIDTGGTVINALKKLKEAKENGAQRVYLMTTHGVFSNNAIEKLATSDFEKIVITDSIPNPEVEKYPEKFVVLSLANLLSKVILNVFNGDSLDSVVKYEKDLVVEENHK